MDNSIIKDFENKNALVVGMGKSGIAATQALLKLGANVSVQDSKQEEEIEQHLIQFLKGKGVKCYFGCKPEDMSIFDLLILSPGIPPGLDFIKEAEKAGAEIVGELEIAYRLCRGKMVAITGTNGKTTTTTLVGEIFKNAGRDTHVVGNIGVAVISKALESGEHTWLITETSSFQLETIRYLKPVISSILNLTPDHFDRHGNMENYGDAKARVFENQDEDDYLVINYDDKECYKLSEDCRAGVVPFSRKEELDFGAFVRDGMICIKDRSGKLTEICGERDLKIPGSHNLENALAAAAIGWFAGIDPQTIGKTLKEFDGVAHRIEFCGEVDGVRFVNDSKGTNPDAAIKAVEAMSGRIILIAGGYDKNSKYEDLINAFNGKVKHMILLGKTAPKIKETAERMGFFDITIVKDMEECVKLGFQLAEPGETVLLSPACASWDMYTSFEQRGDHFKNCVLRLER